MMPTDLNASDGRPRVDNAMTVDRTSRRADLAIGPSAPGAASVPIGYSPLLDDTSPTPRVVMTFEAIGHFFSSYLFTAPRTDDTSPIDDVVAEVV